MARPLPSAQARRLSSDLGEPDHVPYFLWDEPMTVTDLRRRLASASRPERIRLLAKVLREAREVRDQWTELAPRLGRRRAFWKFLLSSWERDGLLSS